MFLAGRRRTSRNSRRRLQTKKRLQENRAIPCVLLSLMHVTNLLSRSLLLGLGVSSGEFRDDGFGALLFSSSRYSLYKCVTLEGVKTTTFRNCCSTQTEQFWCMLFLLFWDVPGCCSSDLATQTPFSDVSPLFVGL